MIGDGDNLISKHVCTNLPKVQEFPVRLDLNTDVTFDTITASVRIQHLPSVSSSNVTTLTELYTSFFLSLTLDPKSPPPPSHYFHDTKCSLLFSSNLPECLLPISGHYNSVFSKFCYSISCVLLLRSRTQAPG